ncbi:hypothetical protein JCM10213v2_006511 [Rhodosporidiobolus nylandii]
MPSSPPLIHSNEHTFLPSHVPSYRCATCTLELTLQDELVSRAFQGGSGPAFLVRSAVNVETGDKVRKMLLSGKHTIAPLKCSGCGTELGWKYFVSPGSSQKYKEGKVILEQDNKWRLDD